MPFIRNEIREECVQYLQAWWLKGLRNTLGMKTVQILFRQRHSLGFLFNDFFSLLSNILGVVWGHNNFQKDLKVKFCLRFKQLYLPPQVPEMKLVGFSNNVFLSWVGPFGQMRYRFCKEERMEGVSRWNGRFNVLCVWPGDRIGEVILVRGQVGIVNIWQSGKQSKVFYS